MILGFLIFIIMYGLKACRSGTRIQHGGCWVSSRGTFFKQRSREFSRSTHFSSRLHAHMPDDVFVIDFDGVLADTQMEVMSAGLNCAMEVWPDAFRDISTDEVMKGLVRVRPRLVKGYESMVMARMLAEDLGNVNVILECENWADSQSGVVSHVLDTYGNDVDELEAVFEAWRRNRIENNFEDWIMLNPLYDGIQSAVSDCQAPFYIASSKAGNRLIPLLNTLLSMEVDEDSPRVFSGLIPPNELKLEVLETVLQRPIAQGERTVLHFIDDRFETIEYIAQHGSAELLKKFVLYLAGWGYCTEDERQKARELGIRVLDLDEFCELLRFQIIMKVNDGCQETEEETLARVYKKSE